MESVVPIVSTTFSSTCGIRYTDTSLALALFTTQYQRIRHGLQSTGEGVHAWQGEVLI